MQCLNNQVSYHIYIHTLPPLHTTDLTPSTLPNTPPSLNAPSSIPSLSDSYARNGLGTAHAPVVRCASHEKRPELGEEAPELCETRRWIGW